MPRLLSLLAASLCFIAPSLSADDWHSLFNGKDLAGWRANGMPESFTVVDGAIRVNATKESAHLFFVGNLKDGFPRFKNFELEAPNRSFHP